MAVRSAVMNVMARAATKAGRSLLRDFGEVERLQVSRKGPADFVSTADLKAEKIVREALAAARPDFGFLMEESGVSGEGAESRFIVDPLDGTTNFLHGLPHWAVSIALEQRGEITAGVVYDPVKDELFWAEKGRGCWLNHDERLRVSGRTRLDDALIATGLGFKGKDKGPSLLHEIDAVMRTTAGIRRWGSAALDLAYVAAGRVDGFWENDLSPWDMAAGVLLVTEAGGRVTQVDGKADPIYNASVLGANPTLHGRLQTLLRDARTAAGV